MQARHRGEIENQRRGLEYQRQEVEERMARLRAQIEAERQEFEDAIGHGIDALNAARKYRERCGGMATDQSVAWPQINRRKRRPLPGFDGSELALLEPRPRPAPLVDGAQAAIG